MICYLALLCYPFAGTGFLESYTMRRRTRREVRHIR
jgi:hypothetical protein